MKITKTLIISVLCVFISILANFALADSLTSSLLSCRTETNSVHRLQCYDDVSSALTAEQQQAAPNIIMPPTVSSQPSQIEAEPQSSLVKTFGLPNIPDPEEEISDIKAVVTNVEYNPYKKLIVSIDIDQVWQQTDGSRMRLRVGDTVYLERAALGSFFLGIEDKNKKMRVKRIK